MANQRDISPTKLKIAKEAEKLFAQKGYAATSMEDITAASGSSKGSIYYHFKNKEHLFLFIIETLAEEWKAEWNRKKQHYATNTEKLYAIAEHYVSDFQNPILMASQEFSISEAASAEVIEQVMAINRSQYYETYEQVLADGIQAGEFIAEDPKELMYLLFGMHSGLGFTYFEMDYEEMSKLYRKSIDIFLRGIKIK